MKTSLTLCTAILLLTSWNTFATEAKLHNKSEQCEARALIICSKHIKHHKKYQYCLKEVYSECMHQ
ncbi:hypothetical protein BDE27_2314 [Xenorhabdus ehlersii]|uniref:Uncharacterized protein n=1 Tax=Xenorhabdus ehlersii TaxID=290111 RepID=A0A2D0IYR0_9GAMM|nr:hypothetical protein [Xenorhabdus sp. TS4]MBC8948802.1 hypothetical protein [Xenorhabdus sp. TS4]PHM25318.1 hypothetical protein Xehl_01533 [Xenorhabdus ehlersii]PHM26895.1 hypothetical protein Xehl_00591 [Xenorhabdus ehlersii]RKE90447.1 hypothetical protein BDE27_2314 [Xenorhabdus ehlersii]